MKDTAQKLLAIKLFNKNHFSIWLDRSKLIFKQNNSVIKAMSMNQLKMNYKFNPHSYNVFEIS